MNVYTKEEEKENIKVPPIQWLHGISFTSCGIALYCIPFWFDLRSFRLPN
jgi:hypothetical protein